MYAVFQTTITQWAFLYDCLLTALFYLALAEAGYYPSHTHTAEEASILRNNRSLLWTFFLGHLVFSKTVKLVPHLLRNPADVRFVPVSVLFGYLHNLIKLYGCITVTEVRTLQSILCPRQTLTLDRRPGARARERTRTTTSACCPSPPWP